MPDDDGPELYEMIGTLVEWDGHQGYMLTDDGDRIPVSKTHDAVRGVSFPYSVGCRIHCIVSAEVHYSIQQVRFVVPQKPDANLTRLKALAKANAVRQRGHVLAQFEFMETYSGTIESIDRRKKTGAIRRDDGELIPLDRFSWPFEKQHKVTPGMRVSFQAVHLQDRWTVTRIVSFGDT